MEKIKIINVEKIKLLMVKNNMDEKTLARLMGAALPTVKKFLSGGNQINFTIDRVCRVAEIFDVPINSILNENWEYD